MTHPLSARLEVLVDAPTRFDGAYVLYWMVAARRPHYNFALQRAAKEAARLGRPLVILEALRCDYRWASDRLHAYVLQGMAANRAAFADTSASYLPYVEDAPGAGRGLLEALAKDACLVVTDDQPGFFLRRMQAAAARRLTVRLERVDGNGLMPLRASPGAFPTAHAFRRFLQKSLAPHLIAEGPRPDPLDGIALPEAPDPSAILSRWPLASDALLAAEAAALARLPIDHTVGAVAERGGHVAATARWRRFLDEGLDRYAEDRSHPDRDGGSGLSGWLHFGHLSVHQVWAELARAKGWSPGSLGTDTKGARHGWWGLPEPVEAFLDEVVTWRELGFHFAHHREDFDRFDSLPDWARRTLAAHADDARPHLYALDELARARTHDPLWNAAQRQLLAEGRIHNALRMLWGKKVLEWSPSPEEAAERLIALNNRYAIDGRDPNSYTGIFWVLGRHDRAWGPERTIYGTVRYMSSENSARKWRLESYLARWA